MWNLHGDPKRDDDKWGQEKGMHIMNQQTHLWSSTGCWGLELLLGDKDKRGGIQAM